MMLMCLECEFYMTAFTFSMVLVLRDHEALDSKPLPRKLEPHAARPRGAVL